MKKDFEKKYHSLEKNHFWFKARRKFILQILKDFSKDAKILDIGCSSGLLLNELMEIGFNPDNLYGVDISQDAIDNCKENGIKNSFVMDAQNIELNERFDVIVASDCLEHLKNDNSALNNWSSLLSSGGVACIFVPAFMALWSEHDVANMHFRRYKKNELNIKLIRNGLSPVKISYWNFLLFFPISVIILLGKLRSSKKVENSGNLREINGLNSLLFRIMNFENKLLKYINFPLGVSVFTVATKESPISE